MAVLRGGVGSYGVATVGGYLFCGLDGVEEGCGLRVGEGIGGHDELVSAHVEVDETVDVGIIAEGDGLAEHSVPLLEEGGVGLVVDVGSFLL